VFSKLKSLNISDLEEDRKTMGKIHPKIIGSTIAVTHTTPDKSQIQIQSRS
jgi:hypothetical protein